MIRGSAEYWKRRFDWVEALRDAARAAYAEHLAREHAYRHASVEAASQAILDAFDIGWDAICGGDIGRYAGLKCVLPIGDNGSAVVVKLLQVRAPCDYEDDPPVLFVRRSGKSKWSEEPDDLSAWWVIENMTDMETLDDEGWGKGSSYPLLERPPWEK